MNTKTESSATSQAVTNELRQWILEQVAKGCQPQDLLRTMLAGGWADATARHALQTTLPLGVALLPAQAAAPTALPRQQVPLPEPELAGAPSVIVIDDHPVAVASVLVFMAKFCRACCLVFKPAGAETPSARRWKRPRRKRSRQR